MNHELRCFEVRSINHQHQIIKATSRLLVCLPARTNNDETIKGEMSFSYQEVKYLCPFYRDEEFWIKPKYYTNNLSVTILDILSDMFRRKLGDDESGKATTARYWRKIVEQERRVAVLLIFSDKVYRKYTGLEKPSKQQPIVDNDSSKTSFVTISRANTIVPSDLLSLFWPENLIINEKSDDDRLKGVRLKIRISKQHIHPRSIVVPYPPRVVFEDDNLIAVNKPFGIPSMGETNDLSSNEWNSILTWCRHSTDVHNSQNGRLCDLMNRLDLDVSGLVLLGKSGAYRKRRGFTRDKKSGTTQTQKTIKVYLGIIPKQEQALRITTPRLGFDKKLSKAIIKQQQGQKNDTICRSSIYPLIDLNDGFHSLVAICLEESGQRHQIRFHLSLIDAPISNDRLYGNQAADGTTTRRRTGVGSTLPSKTTPITHKPSGTERSIKERNPLLVHVEQINKDDSQAFLQNYVYANGVTGFQQTESCVINHGYKDGLIRRNLYPCHETEFSDQLKDKFEFCGHCGKCAALQVSEPPRSRDSDETIPTTLRLDHGIYLHSWRYFCPTPEHPMLEADLPGHIGQGNNDGGRTHQWEKRWWPVQILKE
jgi:23S rRNA-/tRNA-specific pseudouridylate synthase